MKRWTLRILLCLILGGITTVGVAWALSYYWFTQDKAAEEWSDPSLIVGSEWEDGAAITGVMRRFGSCWILTTVVAKLPTPQNADPASVEGVVRDPARLPYWSTARRSPREAPDQERALGFPFICMAYEFEVVSSDERRRREQNIRDRYREQRFTRNLSPEEVTKLREAERAELDAIRRLQAEYAGGIEYESAFEMSGTISRYTYGALPMRPLWPGFVLDTLFYAAIWFGLFFGFASAKRAIRRRRGRCPMCGYDLRGAPGLAAGCSECGWNREKIYTAQSTKNVAP